MSPLVDSSEWVRFLADAWDEEEEELSARRGGVYGIRLRERYQSDGYLFVRGLVDPEDVMQAREYLLKTAGVPEWEEASDMDTPTGIHRVSLLGNPEFDRPACVRRVVESLRVAACLSLLEDSIDDCVVSMLVSDVKWLRAVYRGEYTGVHSDSVYFVGWDGKSVSETSSGGGSENGEDVGGEQNPSIRRNGLSSRPARASLVSSLRTVWMPFGDVSVEMGALAVVPGSHVCLWCLKWREKKLYRFRGGKRKTNF